MITRAPVPVPCTTALVKSSDTIVTAVSRVSSPMPQHSSDLHTASRATATDSSMRVRVVL